MNKNKSLQFYTIFFSVFAFALAANAQLVKKQDLVNAWKGMAEYTIALAEKMPEEYYEYKVDPVVRNYGEQMMHIAESNYAIADILKGGSGSFDNDAKTKKEIVAELEKSFEFASKALSKVSLKDLEEQMDFFDGNKRSRFRAYLFMVDHLTHTRGISISYLRAKGIAPPDFKSW